MVDVCELADDIPPVPEDEPPIIVVPDEDPPIMLDDLELDELELGPVDRPVLPTLTDEASAAAAVVGLRLGLNHWARI